MKLYIFIYSIKAIINTNDFLSRIRDVILLEDKQRIQKYVAIIDAGTTGTRLNIYGFLMPEKILDYFSVERTSPGIQTFESINDIESKLNELVDNTESKLNEIGVSLKEIPIVFEATAGMRLLEKKKKHKILKQVTKIFKKKGMKIKEVSIISGITEGLYALESVDYLKNYNFNVVKNYGCKDEALMKNLEPNYLEFCYEDMNTYNKKEYLGIIEMGGGSLQMAYEFDKNDQFTDPLHVIEMNGKKIYINSFDGWGLNEAMKVFKELGIKNLRKEHKKNNIFRALLKDFKVPEKPDINKTDQIFLLSYYHIKFIELGCGQQTNLEEVNSLFNEKCGYKETDFCNEIFYMKSFLDAQGIEKNKNLFLVHDIAGVNLNWTLSRALMMV